jgi:hypothetical protein
LLSTANPKASKTIRRVAEKLAYEFSDDEEKHVICVSKNLCICKEHKERQNSCTEAVHAGLQQQLLHGQP